jgi:hypothetical protein
MSERKPFWNDEQRRVLEQRGQQGKKAIGLLLDTLFGSDKVAAAARDTVVDGVKETIGHAREHAGEIVDAITTSGESDVVQHAFNLLGGDDVPLRAIECLECGTLISSPNKTSPIEPERVIGFMTSHAGHELKRHRVAGPLAKRIP